MYLTPRGVISLYTIPSSQKVLGNFVSLVTYHHIRFEVVLVILSTTSASRRSMSMLKTRVLVSVHDMAWHLPDDELMFIHDLSRCWRSYAQEAGGAGIPGHRPGLWQGRQWTLWVSEVSQGYLRNYHFKKDCWKWHKSKGNKTRLVYITGSCELTV